MKEICTLPLAVGDHIVSICPVDLDEMGDKKALACITAKGHMFLVDPTEVNDNFKPVEVDIKQFDELGRKCDAIMGNGAELDIKPGFSHHETICMLCHGPTNDPDQIRTVCNNCLK